MIIIKLLVANIEQSLKKSWKLIFIFVLPPLSYGC